VDTYVHGITNYTWTNWTGPDVLFGGGAEQFYPGKDSYRGKDYYKEFATAGYNVVWNNTAMQKTSNDTKTLGIFSVLNMVGGLELYPSRTR
jgi:alkaline phosphatase